jgi:hypothetical protein
LISAGQPLGHDAGADDRRDQYCRSQSLCDKATAKRKLGGDNYLGRSATIILAGRVGRERRL